MKKMFLLIMLSIMVIGCQEEEVVTYDETTQEELSLSKESEVGMLQFGSADELNEFISEQVKSEADLLETAKAYSEKGIYNPLLLVYNLEAEEARALGIEEKEVPTVASNDDMLLLLLNEDGEIGIEDKIFRIDGDFVYTYTGGSSDEVDNFNEAYLSGEIRIEKGETLHFSKNLSVYMHNNDEAEEEKDYVSRGQTGYEYFYNSDYRMRAKQFNGYWGFYSSIGANTKVQKKKKFLWWSSWNTYKATNQVSYEASYKVISFFGFPTRYENVSGSLSAYSNQTQKVYEWAVGVPVSPNLFIPQDGYTGHTSYAIGSSETKYLYY